MASVIKKELVKRGVKEERIIEETNSFSKITQITEMIKLSVANGWERIAMMTNEYHLTRIQTIFEQIGTIVEDSEFQEILAMFNRQGSRVAFICTEPIMRIANPLYAVYLSRVEETPQFQHTLATEAKGLEDLKAGRYKVVLQPEKPRFKNI